MIFILLFLLLVAKALASPAPDGRLRVDEQDSVSIQTSFIKYVSCPNEHIDILKRTIDDAVRLASAGLDYINDGLSRASYPQKAHQQVDFSKEAAIEFFGPESENFFEQARIFDTMFKAADAYPGWGFLDWWNNRYVVLSCLDHHKDKPCSQAGYVAYFDPNFRDYGYPVVVFCGVFFDMQSLDEAIAKIDQNPDLQQNLANMDTRATCFMHELLHINWGSAQECRGLYDGQGCNDHLQIIGNKPVRTYGTGKSKLLAKRNVTLAATNNDNYVYYSMAKLMEKRWNKYPKYPSAWDPSKSEEENLDRERKEPGYPSSLNVDLSVDWELGVGGDNESPVPDDPLFPVTAYPDWYQPKIVAKFDDPVPDVHEPTDNPLTYNGPNADDVVCETSDGSPLIRDCYHAFGELKNNPSMGALHGKKDGTWWAGYVQSCALAIYYTEDWSDACQATLKDVNDHATAILEKCSSTDNGKVGGHVVFANANCPAHIEIIHATGTPPQGT